MSGVLSFCKKVQEKRGNDAKIAEIVKRMHKYTLINIDRVTFMVVCKSITPGIISAGIRPPNFPIMLELDNEDIDYLFAKYHKRLKDEFRVKQVTLEKEYNKLIKLKEI